MASIFPGGTVHEPADDLRAAIEADPALLSLWESLTPLGRIVRTGEELREGKKRPCCWAGCIHRTDKAPSRWQQAVLIDGKRKTAR